VRRAVVLALLLFACAPTAPANAPAPGVRVEPGRSPRWAIPVSRPGLENFFRVDSGLYRGAQPDRQGMQELHAMGVRTVVNLRSLHSDRDEMEGLPLQYEHIHMQAWYPEDEDVVRFLRVATNPANQPVFLHCQHGADRTGTLIAVYRVAVQGWTKDEAIDEMMRGGYGFHGIWTNLTDYVRDLDIERIRRLAGITASRSDKSAD
jgi:protein tyrosine phosphatase (PTP) superfamily phosphohydrolase (DUF442 family)